MHTNPYLIKDTTIELLSRSLNTTESRIKSIKSHEILRYFKNQKLKLKLPRDKEHRHQIKIANFQIKSIL